MPQQQSRRHFLVAFTTVVVAALIPGRVLRAGSLRTVVQGPHPTPRSGITGAKVLTKDQLADKPKLVSLFDSVREIPEVVDGIRCK